MSNQNDTTTRITQIVTAAIHKGDGDAVIARLIAGLDDADALAQELEGISEFPDYLSAAEATEIVSHFENFDGSRGPHWRDQEALFRAAESAGVKTEISGHYNRFAFFAVANMIWSDFWGVMRQYADNSKEAAICSQMAYAYLCDRDRDTTVRWYFGLD